jgi:chromate transport protein ChrA
VREVCPEFPGHPQLIHWSIDDPSGEGYPAFRRVAAELRTRIGFLLAGSGPRGRPVQASLGTVVREWGRIGCIGFGGPPGRRAGLHRARPRLHPRAVRLVPGGHAAVVGEGSRRRGGRRGRRGRGPGGLDPARPELGPRPPERALSFGGGFVIIPLMRADAVGRHWMTSGQFLNAVALGQITPGPVVLTVSAVGYAAADPGGGLLAALVAFSPSFAFVLGGAPYFSALRTSGQAQASLDGAGTAAIGAILGAAILLAGALRPPLGQPWQFAVLAGAAVLLLGLRRGVMLTLLAAAATGLLVALAGGPLPH